MPLPCLRLWQGRGVMIRLAPAIVERLERGESLVLATILSHAGSTPRTSGAKMIIDADGGIEGTIGGGLVEAEVMQAALEMMGTDASAIRSYNLNIGSRADSMDMICGGRLDVLLEPIAPAPSTIGFFRSLSDALANGRKCVAVTPLPSPGAPADAARKRLIGALGPDPAEPPLPPDLGAEVLEAVMGGPARAATYPPENPRYLLEPICVPDTVVLFGAGHVSQAVAALTRMVGFRTIVRDDRAEFANRQRFPTADAVEVIPSFDEALTGLDIGTDAYLVIVTRGHSHDGTVLALSLASNAGYIGMIGSRRKRDTIYRSMRARGFTSRDLERVHSPIGLSIGADTPEEIAVSIVAELIKIRAHKGKHNESTAAPPP